jgi:hypothetical protein
MLGVVMMVPGVDFIEKFTRLFRRLDTAFAGERGATAHALYRLCTGSDVKIVDLAEALKNSFQNGAGELAEKKYTDDDAAVIFARGVERGRAENARQSPAQLTYLDENFEPRWQEIANFCRRDPGFNVLKANEQNFITEMPGKLAYYGRPTPPQAGFLLSIFWKMRGSFQ